MKQLAIFLGKVLFHLAACATIAVLFYPLAVWYFNASPLWGVDFYYTASLVNLLKSNFVLPPFAWFYAWFSGWPWLSSYPILHAYLIVPLTTVLGITSAVKIWMLITLGIYFAGIYACAYKLSKNIGISLILAVSAIYSVGVYGSLMWGGSLPSHATQGFYPWSIFFLIVYFQKKKMTDLLIAALIAGFAIWGHPQIVIAYIYPTAGVLSLFWIHNWKLFDRIRALIIFVVVSFVIGLPLLYSSFGEATKSLIITNAIDTATSTVRVDPQLAQDIKAFHLSQPRRIVIDTNATTFFLLAIAAVYFIGTILLTRDSAHRQQIIKQTIPFIMLAFTYIIYVTMFAFGISIYHGGWYRLFWASPFWIGMLVASFWGVSQQAWKQYLPKTVHLIKLGSTTLLVLIFGIVGVLFFGSDVREKIIPRSAPSSAFPDIVNLRSDQTFTALSSKMVPSWLDTYQKNYRLYCGDQTVNIWWNALYTMPLSRGYFDPPVSTQNRGYFFWLDAALSQSGEERKDQLVDSFHYPPDVALKNTLFLVDWYAIKFAEGGHAGPTAYAPLPQSLANDTYIEREETLDFNAEKYNKGSQTLHYYELKDSVVRPILTATNAPTVGVFASEQGFETVVRALADSGMGSTEVIPLKLGKQIENLSDADSDRIDALFLYDYDYGNKSRAYDILKKFLKKGKHVFIDTGFEVKEAQSTNLPDIFPITQTVRKPMGDQWQLELSDETITDIDISLFDPPVFDKAEWNLSYPQQDSFVDPSTKIILKNKGIPIVASKQTGGGTFFWSGMNLPYHVTRFHNNEEAKFFRALLEKMLPKPENSPTYTAEFIHPEQRKISFQNTKGILLKEQAYPGWTATVVNGNKKEALNIYKAGPSFPGFMYAPVPPEFQSRGAVTLSYHGDPKTIALSILVLLITLYILDRAITRNFFFGWLTRLSHRVVGVRVHKWWNKEEEE